ncbi:putative signal peptide protein [Puccinia sorghi]|uniref:Putative signal peptide protein n=1 Tax=Puccinia sorghi TaxID=27349 RepID=A0A0L6UVQ3_9BASI|nr:putative signal peptide protein [Puccinia sorghi]
MCFPILVHPLFTSLVETQSNPALTCPVFHSQSRDTSLSTKFLFIQITVMCMYSSVQNTSAMCFWHCNANGTPHHNRKIVLVTILDKYNEYTFENNKALQDLDLPHQPQRLWTAKLISLHVMTLMVLIKVESFHFFYYSFDSQNVCQPKSQESIKKNNNYRSKGSLDQENEDSNEKLCPIPLSPEVFGMTRNLSLEFSTSSIPGTFNEGLNRASENPHKSYYVLSDSSKECSRHLNFSSYQALFWTRATHSAYFDPETHHKRETKNRMIQLYEIQLQNTNKTIQTLSSKEGDQPKNGDQYTQKQMNLKFHTQPLPDFLSTHDNRLPQAATSKPPNEELASKRIYPSMILYFFFLFFCDIPCHVTHLSYLSSKSHKSTKMRNERKLDNSNPIMAIAINFALLLDLRKKHPMKQQPNQMKFLLHSLIHILSLVYSDFSTLELMQAHHMFQKFSSRLVICCLNWQIPEVNMIAEWGIVELIQWSMRPCCNGQG